MSQPIAGHRVQIIGVQRAQNGKCRANLHQAVPARTRILVLAILVTRIAAAALYTATCHSGGGYYSLEFFTRATVFTGINKNGDIVGYTSLGGFSGPLQQQAYLFKGGTPDTFVVAGTATAINASGQIVGVIQADNRAPAQAYLYTNGVLTPLGFVPDAT